ncbi:MAG: tyrosine-type recombinase/integrase [Marinobacter sp.]|nr:tyrosine-type recombinase/integrase [Marinobacter sp.]
MIVNLGFAMSIKTKYIQKRGRIFQFVLRVPSDLVDTYGKRFIRKSLKTEDPTKAVRSAEHLAKRYNMEFSALRGSSDLSPSDVFVSANHLAKQYGSFDYFVEKVAEPKRQAFAADCEETYETASIEDFLSPAEVTTLRLLQNPSELRLSGVIELYLEHNPKGSEEGFARRCRHYWTTLMELTGDIPFSELSRPHARAYVDRCLAEGSSTATVRRRINQVRAVVNLTIHETGQQRANPFSALTIPGEGKDEKKRRVPTNTELTEIVQKLEPDVRSTSLLILMQLETGARIGELAGLAVDDIALKHQIPHIIIRPHPWRDLKTSVSRRTIPLTSLALIAAENAVKQHGGENPGLFPQYAKTRGQDSASAAVNKRLKGWNITSHCLRHSMKDRLRNAGVPKDIRDAIQGHGSGDMDDEYGLGFSLDRKLEALQKVTIKLSGSQENQADQRQIPQP